mgnify:FL=1
MSYRHSFAGSPLTENKCGRCNAEAVAKVTDGKVTIKVCHCHLSVLKDLDWEQVDGVKV